jgi:feruloyl esterase
MLLSYALMGANVTLAMPSLDCEHLRELDSEGVSVLDVALEPASEVLPAHCLVHGRIPMALNFELRLPQEWNGKFLMVGNGGYLGMFFDQSYGLARGYATASTDTGHSGPDPTFALNNRSAEIDFAYRAVHVTVQIARRFINHFYGREPKYAYFRGCSTGGRQGLMEAQRYPDDFDGWSIGAPIYDYTDKQIYNAAWVTQAMFGNHRKGYVPHTKLKTLGKAVLARCDGIDGLEDGLIGDPRRCDFVPDRDLETCQDSMDRSDCFSTFQIDALTKIYNGPPGGRYPGHIKGGEWLEAPEGHMTGGWDTYITGIIQPQEQVKNAIGQMDLDPYGGNEFMPVQMRNADSFFKFLAFEHDQPDFDLLVDLDFAQVPDTSFMANLMNADDPDIDHLRRAGKKLLLWHGWADVGLNPLRTIQYFEAVQKISGVDKTATFARLFMVPGMYHCEGGPGPDVFDDLSALETWVEDGKAPERMTAFKTVGTNDFYPDRRPGNRHHDDVQVLRSRPLCAYPKVARYQGKGSSERAENFACTDPPP